jgi:hemerythrin superfamily protein
MDILDKLHTEHETVKGLLSRMVDSEDAQERKALFEEFKDALVRHARAEEKVMYDPMIALHEEEPEQQGDEGYIEHELVDVMLKKLDKARDKASIEWTAGIKVVKELVNHHIKEEEESFFQTVKDNFSEEEREAMNEKFEARKKRVKVP